MFKFSTFSRFSFAISGRFFLLILFGIEAFDVYSQTADTLRDQSLREVVIQTTRADHQAPSPHTNLKADRIANTLHSQDMPWLLAQLPSVVEQSDAGLGIGYTGMRIRGGDQTRINVTLNGVPLNDAESQNVFWVDLPDLGASAAEIQVQRGVGLSTNGAGAFGATVNIDLSRVSVAPAASMDLTLGSFNTRKYSANLASGAIGDWVFSGRLSQISSDGFIDRSQVKLNSHHLMATRLAERSSFQMHWLSGEELTHQAWNGVPVQWVDSFPTHNTAGAERPGSPHPNEIDQYRQDHFLAHFRNVITPLLRLQINAHYTRGKGYFEQYKADQNALDYGLIENSDPIFVDLIRRRQLDNHFFGMTWALISEQSNKVENTVGGSVHQYLGRHFGEIIWAENLTPAGDHLYYDNTAQKTDANLYVQHRRTLRGGWDALLDLQGRWVHYQFLGISPEGSPEDQMVDHVFFNPKAGLSKKIDTNAEWYAFAGVAHREPNRDDYTQSSRNSRPDAERMFNLETGMRRGVKHLKTQANFFMMYYQNQLALNGQINDVGAYTRINIPKSYRTGLELEAETAGFARWQLSGNCTWSRNRIVEWTEYRDNWATFEQMPILHRNTAIAFSPEWVAQAEATAWLIPNTKPAHASISLGFKYVSSQYLDNTAQSAVILPDYQYANLRFNAHFPFGKSKFDLIFSINNLMNRQYISNGWVYRFSSPDYDPRPDDPHARLESGNNYHLMGLFPQAGRHWMLTVRAGI